MYPPCGSGIVFPGAAYINCQHRVFMDRREAEFLLSEIMDRLYEIAKCLYDKNVCQKSELRKIIEECRELLCRLEALMVGEQKRDLVSGRVVGG